MFRSSCDENPQSHINSHLYAAIHRHALDGVKNAASGHLRRKSQGFTLAAKRIHNPTLDRISTLPFLATFPFISIIIFQKFVHLLSRERSLKRLGDMDKNGCPIRMRTLKKSCCTISFDPIISLRLTTIKSIFARDPVS